MLLAENDNLKINYDNLKKDYNIKLQDVKITLFIIFYFIQFSYIIDQNDLLRQDNVNIFIYF
jgi:hypothetical protein